jgi:hypothetical protein
MKRIVEPWWIFLVNTLPLTLFILIMAGEYSVVKSLIPPEQILLWRWFTIALLMLMAISALFAGVMIVVKRPLPVLWGIASLLVWIAWAYLYGMHIERMIPSDVPFWMMSENILLYAGAFLMPTLGYYLLLIVVKITENTDNQKPWINFLIAVAIPLTGYFFVEVIFPLWQPTESSFRIHAFIVVVILATLIFLFFLVRGFYIIVSRRSAQWRRYALLWKIPFTIVLPILGLLLNNGFIFWSTVMDMEGIFGDFHHHWFYILAILNGVLLCLPNLQNVWYRVVLFTARAVTLAYTVYFLFVFLPFLPLSLVAIIAFGTGVLMLTPLILFIIHINELIHDYRFLRGRFRAVLIWSLAGIGFLVIPAAVTTGYLHDRGVLHRALAYVYAPDYTKDVVVPDAARLQTVFAAIRDNRQSNQIIFSKQTPYLSAWYKRIVLDNLTLSEQKINTMERVFFGADPIRSGDDFFLNQGVVLTDIKTKSRWNDSTGLYHSRIDLEITNQDPSTLLKEYVTEFELPDGCYISDYDLVIEGKREGGILVEKRSALWVFSMIRQVQRDPGILWYKSGHRIGFHIYPFQGNEVRYTGIELVHKDPVTLDIDGRSVRLVEDTVKGFSAPAALPEGMRYVSVEDKLNLKRVQRKPYFHFIVDVSAGAQKDLEMYSEVIDDLLADYQSVIEERRFSFVNGSVTNTEDPKNWKDALSRQQFKGGFFLDRAIRSLLIAHYDRQPDSFPILVVVSRAPEKAIMLNDFGDLEFTYPDGEHFYHINAEGELFAHSLFMNPMVAADSVAGIRQPKPVLAIQDSAGSIVYLPDNARPSITFDASGFNPERVGSDRGLWWNALQQHGMWIWLVLHPEQEGKYWRKLVKSSFDTGILTPLTSYIVVENEAQRAALLRKQEKVLKGHRQLDLNDDVVSMTEPGLLWPVVLLLLVVAGYRLRKTGF